MARFRVQNGKRPDYILVFTTFALVVFGLVMLASASSDLAKTKYGDSYFFLKHQLIYGLVPGLIGFWVGSKLYYQRYKKLSVGLIALGIIALILVFTPLGSKAGGADRWLGIGPIVFQPSELLKIFFIIYVAAWLSGNEKRKNSFWLGFVPLMFIIGIIAVLLILQPATSIVAILIAVAMGIYFVSGARLSYIIGFIVIGTAIFLLVSYSTSYRWERIMSFLHPDVNTQSSNYHINQARIAIGAGGLTGVGYGQSTTKIRFLPEPIGDSIFAVIAEEMGFIGGALVVVAFLTLVIRGLILSRKTHDNFAKLLLVGFSTIIGTQAFINIGAISGVIPLTGMPLPYISYGGTALAVFMTISGIMINISKYA